MPGFKKYSTGDGVPREAKFYNALVDQLNASGAELKDAPKIPRQAYTRVRMRNAGTSTIEIYSPCLMTGPIFDPTVAAGSNQGNELLFAQSLPMDVSRVASGAWTLNSGRPVVALDRVPAGKVGWFAINGLVPARVYTNVGLTNYNLGYCYPSGDRFWEVVGGPAINSHTQIFGYKIIWQSGLISSGGEWRWAIVDLGDRGPYVQNLFTVHREQNAGGITSQTATQIRGVVAVPLAWQANGTSSPWGTFGPGNSNSNLSNWYRPYVQYTSAKAYEFYRDVGVRFTLSGILQIPATNSDTQGAYGRIEAVIANDSTTLPNKIIARASMQDVAQGWYEPLSGKWIGTEFPFTAQLYCPAGCYFAQNAGGGNAGRWNVRFEYFVYVTGGSTPTAWGSVNNLTISCDLLHENFAAVAGHLPSTGGYPGGPLPPQIP